MEHKLLAALFVVGFALTGCGGGGGGDTISSVGGGGTGGTDGGTNTGGSVAAVPTSAFQNVDAFVAFLRGLGADENSEPLTLPQQAAPTSDTAEPAA